MTPPLYRTNDIYLASFLVSRGIDLEGCTRLRPKKTEYLFVADERLHELLQLYWGETLLPAVPKQLLKTLHQLRCLTIAQGRK